MKNFRCFSLTILLFFSATLSAGASFSEKEYAPYVTFVWQAPAYSNMTWMIRETVVTQSGHASYFSIMGNWSPPFYLGIQDFDRPDESKKVAIFSAWDTYENNNCSTCGPESRPNVGKTTIKAVGSGVTPGQFGYEGTGVNSFINDLNWKVGDRIRAVVNLNPVEGGTELSAAIQVNDSPWRYFATYRYSKIFNSLEPGYSFIEDFGRTANIVRSAEYRNTWMENEDLSSITRMSSVYSVASKGGSETENNKPYHRIEQRDKSGLWVQSGGNQFINQENVSFSLTKTDELIPLEARMAALNLSGASKFDYEIKYAEYKEFITSKNQPKPETKPMNSTKKRSKKITCTKGKLFLTIKAKDPKCPKGYKQN